MNSEKRRQSDRMDAYVQRENIYDLISFNGLGTDRVGKQFIFDIKA